jgi:hypothetical protein
MPPVAINVYTHMMLAPNVPAKDISIYLHLSDGMLRELILKANLLSHQLPPRMMAALSNRHNPDLRSLLNKVSAPTETLTLPSTAARETTVDIRMCALHALLLDMQTTTVRLP